MEQPYLLGVHRGAWLRRLLGCIYLLWRLERRRRPRDFWPRDFWPRDLRLLPPARDVFVGVVAATGGATAGAFAGAAFAAGAGGAGAAFAGGAAGVASSSSLPRSQSKNPILLIVKPKKETLKVLFFVFYFGYYTFISLMLFVPIGPQTPSELKPQA